MKLSFLLEVFMLWIKIGYYYCEAFVRLFMTKPLKSVREDVILITGGEHGLGREMALRFARLGAKVVIWDINKVGVDATADEINNTGGYARAYVCDVTKVDDVNSIADQVRREVGDVTILINNAGILNGLDLLSLTDDQIRRCINVNTLAHFWTVRAFLPKMQENNHGHIVTIASMAARTGAKNLVDYCASKWGAFGFTEALSEEIRASGLTGIKTTTICPTFVSTGLAWHMNSRIIPILQPDQAADIMVDGILKEERLTFVPRDLAGTEIIAAILPRKAYLMVNDFMGVWLDSHKEGPKKSD